MVKNKVIALDIGGTNTRAALIDENYNILSSCILPTITDDKDKFVEQVFNSIEGLNANMDEVAAFGIDVPGVVNKETGYIYDLPNVHVKDIDMKKIIFDKYGKNMALINDAQAAALAEYKFGEGKGLDSLFFITISTGLGGALVTQGKEADYITEVGHTLFRYDGKLCEYEGLVSGPGIKKLCKMHGVEIDSAREFFNKIREGGDTKIHYIYNEWLLILTRFLTMVDNSYHPDVIAFTGGVFKNKDLFFEELRTRLPHIYMKECALKEEAGIKGAAIIAWNIA